jgi:hypothetical protein
MKSLLSIVFTAVAGTPLFGAGLTLTPAGVSNGFALTTFATINPGATGNTGPYGVAVTGGHVLVNNFVNNTLYVFNDVDGQTTGSAISAISPSNSLDSAFASVGGTAYGGVFPQFVQFNSNGTVNHVLTGITQSSYFGMWGNPVNGHILSTTFQGQIIDINPAGNGGTGSAVVVTTPGAGMDGVTVSPDGNTVYVEQNSHIFGYTIATGVQVFDSGVLSGQPDGIGIISSSNPLNGQMIVNFNGGTVGLLNLTTHVLTTIAGGGTRGDYIAPDPTNGTVFLDYSDIVYRLSCGSGCSIGSAAPSSPATTPIPPTWILAGLSLACLALYQVKMRLGRMHR